MTDATLPDAIATAVESIRASTAALLRAAADTDPDGMARAVEQRGHGVERFEREVRRAWDDLGGDQRDAVREVWAAIDGEARNVGERLSTFVARRGEIVGRLRREHHAARTYQGAAENGRGHLDRAG